MTASTVRRQALAVVAALLAPALAAPASAQWTPQASNTTAELRGLAVVSAKVVWASGTRGRVVHTVDGGKTWVVDTVPGADSLDFRSIHAFGARSAIVASAGEAQKGQARIYRTDDGGKRWSLVYQTTRAGVFLDAIDFWDPTHGVVLSDPVDGKFVLLLTSDGGRSWAPVDPARIPPALPNEGAFAASGTCLIARGARDAWFATGGAATARVFRTADRGRTWTVVETPVHAGDAASGIFSLAFRDARHGIAVGGNYAKPHEALDNVALTSDGGRTWRSAPGPLPPAYLSGAAHLPDGNTAFVAVGLAGTFASPDGEGWFAQEDTTGYNTVRFAGPRAGWAVGPRGRIARWTGPMTIQAEAPKN